MYILLAFGSIMEKIEKENSITSYTCSPNRLLKSCEVFRHSIKLWSLVEVVKSAML